MSEVFGAGYSPAYDALYRAKDYAGECDLIEAVFREFGDGGIKRVVDLGCGTGGHAIPLAQRGYDVTGVDRSASMLAEARAKAMAAKVGGRTTWIESDLVAAALHPAVDAALMMFAVLGYLETTELVARALATAARLVRPGGLLIFDVWYGPAVEWQGTEPRRREILEGEKRFVRLTDASLDRKAQLSVVSLKLQEFRGDRLVSETIEHHRMRYFFREELATGLRGAGFEPLRFAPFPELGGEPDKSTWNLLVVSRRIR